MLMLDTAGRLHVDQQLMDEMQRLRRFRSPQEILLVVDSLTGQDAVNVAKSFGERVDLTGIVLTRMDGDARGGAALSMRAITGKPIKFAGVGEKLDAIEAFNPSSALPVAFLAWAMSSGWSNVRAEIVDKDEADKLAAKMAKGQFDMNDLRTQFRQMTQDGRSWVRLQA